jgi:hypothetical protein
VKEARAAVSAERLLDAVAVAPVAETLALSAFD